MADENTNTGIQFEDIVPWENETGDTGLTARLKLKRNFDKIKTWMDDNGLAVDMVREMIEETSVTKDFFNAIFRLEDVDGNAITPNNATTAKDRLKILVGTYTDQYLSALGLGTDGSGGAGDVTWDLLADSNDTRPIALSHLITALSTYATQSWVQSQGYATIATVNAWEFLNNVTSGGNGFVTLSTNKGNSFVLDLTHQHSWFEILDRPTTIAGFGITDVYISNGVITIGTNTITPVTQVAMTVPTGFNVTGSPITKTGTLAVTYATGYEGFTTALKQKIEALFSWFEVDADGNVKTKDWDDNGTSKHRGFYSPSFISALGQGDDGSAGSGDVTWELLADSNDTRQIASSHLSTALAGYATQQWVTSQGYLTQHQSLANYYTKDETDTAISTAINVLEYLNNVTSGGNGFVTLSTNKGNSFVLDLTHQHSWFEILDRPTTIAGFGIVMTADDIPALDWSKIATGKPTTLAGYGITDASISDGVITLGSSTITPITSVNMTVPTGFNVSGVPISKTGTIALTYTTGYEGFTTALKQKIEALYSWFEIDSNGNVKTKDWDDNGTTKHRGFYSPSFISALGQGNDGSAGTGDVTWALLADSNDTRQIALSHLTTALAGYATTSWVTSQNYATQTWVTSQGYATAAAVNALEFLNAATGGNGTFTLSTNKNNSFVLDLTHQHSWFDIQDRPTTIAGLGVKSDLNSILSSYVQTSALRSLTIQGDGNTIGTYTPTSSITINFAGGSNISITRDTTTHTLTFANTYSYTHPGGGADTTITAANGRVLSAITVNGLGHVSNVGYKTLSMADMPDAMQYFSSATAGSGIVTLSGRNVSDTIIDFTHQHSWFEIQDKPTTLKGFGISADDELLLNNYISISFFNRLFEAYNNNSRVYPNNLTTTINNLKLMVGTWTSQYLSALGLGTDGTSGDFNEAQMWAALGTNSTQKQISSTYLATATRYNNIVINKNGSIKFSGVGVTEIVVDLTHGHDFGEITARPDSLAGYGITDAYILGTKVYLGGQSIDVSGSQIDLTGYATQNWVSSNYQIKGNYLTSADLSGYVPKTGSALNTDACISRTGSSVSWYQGRVYPIIKTTSYTGYNAILSLKTTNGSWDMGVYTNNNLYLTYITDTNYNNSNNEATYQLLFPKDSGTIALTKQIPTSLPASDVYAWAKAATKPSYSWSEITSKPTVAVQGEHNNLTASGNEFTSAATNQSGSYYWNYRTAGGTNGSITEYRFCTGNGLGSLASLVASSITANGLLYSTYSDNTVTIGSQNKSWCHIYNSAAIPFIFNQDVYTIGSFKPYSTNNDLGGSSSYFRYGYINALVIGANRYYGNSQYGIHMNNSDIIGCNSIRTGDLSDDYTEGLLFARSNGNWDSFRAVNGTFYMEANNAGSYAAVYVGSLYSTGAVTSLSDERKKDIKGNIRLGVEQIANAPAIRFLWKEDIEAGMQAGSIAQYWQKELPEVVREIDGVLTMQYGVAALIASISLASKIQDHERRISELERENRELKNKLKAA